MDLLRRQRISDTVSLHNLYIAAYFCGGLLKMDQGSIVADGKPAPVPTPRTVQDIYCFPPEVDTHRATARTRLRSIPDAIDG